MACSHCQNSTIIKGKTCEHCGGVLALPLYLRLWFHISTAKSNPSFSTFRWVLHTLAASFFLGSSTILVLQIGGLHPSGELHRLFVGLSFLALGAVGWFAGQALSLYSKSLLARIQGGLLACCSVGALATFLFLGSQAQPIEETLLAHFSTQAQTAIIGEHQLRLPTGQIGFEYLQVDHETFGIHHVVPLAFLGEDRLTVPHGNIQDTLIQHLKANPDRYGSRGFTIRVRIDLHQTTPGKDYEIVQREGQVLVRNANSSFSFPNQEHS